MLTRILHNSEKLSALLDELELELYQPQRRHLLNMADALLVCEEPKTLAALQRQFVKAPDASNMADFLRISPWEASWVRDGLRKYQLSWLIAEAEREGKPRCIYINVDDSLGAKDKATSHLEPVAWHFDHNESQKGKPKYKNAFCFVACTVRLGNYVGTVDLHQQFPQLGCVQPRKVKAAPQSRENITEASKPSTQAGWKLRPLRPRQVVNPSAKAVEGQCQKTAGG